MPTPRYRSILPLSLMAPTFYPADHGIVQPKGQAPLIQLQDPDLQARAQRLVNVLYWTANTYKDHDGMADSDTLKVFIVPEFYFRKASAEEVRRGGFVPGTSFGSYPEESRYALAEALYDAIHQSALFNDWTIVAGTICSAMTPRPDGRLNLLNTAIMLRGRRPVMDDSVPYVLMEKHYISNIDGPDPHSHANLDPTTTYSFRLNPDQHLDNLIYWDGMSLGLEVCLDHCMQVVKNAVSVIRQSLGPDSINLDLQLVTSCGMSIVDQAVAVRDGALVMLTDGMSYAGNHFPEPIFQVGRYNARTGRVDVNDPDNFLFTELPGESSYQILQYAQGRYVELGRRQGVWVSNDRLPMFIV
ncbi:hypothetical protein HDE76_000672 [Rhodanobacter sp. ANJX3]|uniref:hypothetical protein n=1 Tax=Rhodanobacter sp. ANJX3 TaxID=2723083 RepID=UPI00161A377D|nr:hypothetical protein [Rhodanobacter sp. ANJX3]MBB5357490.1 hypothetical protein [Rhodanobacter sp. ANJX3]